MGLKRKLDVDSSEDFPQVCIPPDLLYPAYIYLISDCQTVKIGPIPRLRARP